MEPWEAAAQSQQAPSQLEPWEAAAQSKPQSQGFFSRLGTDWDNRVSQAQEAANRDVAGPQSFGEAVMNSAITPKAEMYTQLVGGPVADFGKEVVNSVTPFLQKQAADIPGLQNYSNAWNKNIGPAISSGASDVGQLYHQLPQYVQGAGNAVGTGVQAASVLSPAMSIAGKVGPTVGEAASAAGNAAMSVPRGVAEGAGNIANGFMARNADQLEQDLQGMYSDSTKSYNQMRSVGATLNPQAANDLMNNVTSAVNSKKFIPELNPQTTTILKSLQNDIATNGTIGLDDLDQYRRLLGRVPATEDGVSAGLARGAIDGEVNQFDGSDLLNGTKDAVDALNVGRKTFQQASKFDDIATIVQKAAGDPNKLKAGLAKFMSDPSNTIGWSPEEVVAGKNAANTSITEGLAKLGGKFGFDPGASNVGSAWAGLTGGAAMGAAAGPIAGIAVPAVGTVARQAQKWLGRGKAENLLQTIEGGIPDAVPRVSPDAPLQISGPGATMYADQLGNISRTPSPASEIVNTQGRPIVGQQSEPQLSLPAPALQLPAPGRYVLTNDEIAAMRNGPISPKTGGVGIRPPSPIDAQTPLAIPPIGRVTPGMTGNLGVQVMTVVKQMAAQGKTPYQIQEYVNSILNARKAAK